EIIPQKPNILKQSLIEWDGKTEMLGSSADISYPNSYGLGLMATKVGEDTVVIGIFDANNHIIQTVESIKGENMNIFVEEAKNVADKIGENISTLKNITKGVITPDDAKIIEIDIFNPNHLSQKTQDILKFWSENTELLQGPKIIKNFFQLSAESGIDYHEPAFKNFFEFMPNRLKAIQEVGYMKLFAGTLEQRSDGITKLFGNDFPFGKITEKNGIFTIHSAVKKGYNILITKDKIGVDGPGLLNWGTKGHFGKIHPVNSLTPDMINEAKTKIESFVKMMAEKPVINE
ncbi:MAG: hypothetical protein AAB530_02605, partial [Patescibacteria group bacterium]